MTLIAKQVRVAAKIDARMQMLLRAGKDDMAILAAMADYEAGIQSGAIKVPR